MEVADSPYFAHRKDIVVKGINSHLTLTDMEKSKKLLNNKEINSNKPNNNSKSLESLCNRSSNNSKNTNNLSSKSKSSSPDLINLNNKINININSSTKFLNNNENSKTNYNIDILTKTLCPIMIKEKISDKDNRNKYIKNKIQSNIKISEFINKKDELSNKLLKE